MSLRFGARVLLPTLLLFACQADDAALFERSGALADAPFVEGKFEMRIASMDDGTERRSYHVRTATGVVELAVDEPIDLAYETFVRVYGEHVDERTFEVDELEVIAFPPEPLIDPGARPHRRIATVLLHWNGAGAYDNAQAKNSMFIDPKSTNVFYGENSYGMETIAGDVFGSYEIEHPGDCYSDLIAERGMEAFVAKGHDPNDYIQFMWYFPSLSCGWSGLANSGNVENPGRDSWYNGNFQCVVRAQEIGHNYGLAHSHAYNCSDEMGNSVPLSDDCQHIEYGDPYDPMGGGCAHMNVVQKSFMGWLEGCNIVTTQSDGIYNILPTELPCNGTQALRFPSYREDRHYYLEYRRPLGVDALNGVTGVLLHESNEFNYTPNVYILDVGSNGQMHEGESYDDPMGVVSFTVLEEHPTHAVVQVTFPGGGSGTPECYGGGEPELVDGNIGSLDCADEPYPLDTVPPTVTITYPADGDVLEPGGFTVTADAMDDRNLTEAELYLDGEPLKKVFDAPWEWELHDVIEGTYEFGVVVRDGPNQGISQVVTIEVMELPDAASTGEVADSSGGEAANEESDNGDDESDEGSSSGSPMTGDPGGCGCRSQGGGTPWFLLLVPALRWCVRRRRS